MLSISWLIYSVLFLDLCVVILGLKKSSYVTVTFLKVDSFYWLSGVLQPLKLPTTISWTDLPGKLLVLLLICRQTFQGPLLLPRWQR